MLYFCTFLLLKRPFFRYLINDTYVKDSKSPILFYTGNEGDIELFASNTGFMWEIAPELNGMLVFAEHRYYGKSLPFANNSYDTPEHLGFLTSEQALADFSLLLDFLNPSTSVPAKNKRPVIAFGGISETFYDSTSEWRK